MQMESQARFELYYDFKDSLDTSHFIFEINIGKGRIRHQGSTTSRLTMTSFKFRLVACRIRLFPALISKIKLFGTILK